MASGLKRWFGLVALSLVAVAAWMAILPPPSAPRGGRILPERQRALRLREQMFRDAWVYQRMEWRDSMIGELDRAVSAGERVVLGLPNEAPDSVRQRLARAVELQFRDMNLTEPAVPLGIFAVPESQGIHPAAQEFRHDLTGGDEYYLAREGEAPYCVIAVPFYDGAAARSEPWLPNPVAQRLRRFAEVSENPGHHPNTLGLCRYFVQFGQPGPLVMEWLKRGGSRFADLTNPPEWDSFYDGGPVRGPFGKTRTGFGGVFPRPLRCLSGEREDCLGLVMDFEALPAHLGWTTIEVPGFLANSPVDFLEGYPRLEDEILTLEYDFLSAVQERFGRERFGGFWRSPLDPPAAFQEAFGESMDLWIMGWLRSRMEPSPRGPGVPLQATLFTLLALGVLAGGAVRMGRR